MGRLVGFWVTLFPPPLNDDKTQSKFAKFQSLNRRPIIMTPLVTGDDERRSLLHTYVRRQRFVLSMDVTVARGQRWCSVSSGRSRNILHFFFNPITMLFSSSLFRFRQISVFRFFRFSVFVTVNVSFAVAERNYTYEAIVIACAVYDCVHSNRSR